MSVRVSRARAVVATGRKPAVVARVARISRQALYRPIRTRPAVAGPGRGRPGDAGSVEVAKANPTDGTRMVAALATRELGQAVNRRRVQWVMRQHRLLQPVRGLDRRRRPGYFRVTRPDELWHMDMTKVWATTDPTPGSATEPPPRSPRPGADSNHDQPTRPEPTTTKGSTSSGTRIE